MKALLVGAAFLITFVLLVLVFHLMMPYSLFVVIAIFMVFVAWCMGNIILEITK